MHAMHLLSNVTIRPNLELKTRPKQLLGSLPLNIALPDIIDEFYYFHEFHCQLHKCFSGQFKIGKQNKNCKIIIPQLLMLHNALSFKLSKHFLLSWRGIDPNVSLPYSIMAQYYKTFYNCNLLMFAKI